MVGLAYASVPLYRLFCQVTGFGGTPQRALANDSQAIDRTVTVQFNADIGGNLPWRFAPAQRAVEVQVGADAMAYFEAENLSDRPVAGSAVFNVTPEKAAPYFVKVQCFCFERQELAPGATASLPVAFFIDPAIAQDPNLDDLGLITLSYTFYPAPPDTSESEPVAAAAVPAASAN
jgi:cytochrome c oxidase assembly protein subunit 11